MSHMELHFAVRVATSKLNIFPESFGFTTAFRDIALGSRGAPQDRGSNEP